MVNDTIERLILNALLRHEQVAMPEIGSLHYGRVAARHDKHGVIPPRGTIRYSRRVEGRTLVDMIAEAAGCDRTAAEEAYGRWLKRVKDGNTVEIEGVGRIANDFFTPSEELNRRLNRVPATEMRLPVRRHAVRWLVPVAAVVVLGGAAALWVGLYGDNGSAGESRTVTELMGANAVQTESAAADEVLTEPAAEELGSAKRNIELSDTLAGTSGDAVVATEAKRPSVNAQAVPAGQPVDIDKSALTRTVRGKFYVVFGVFSTAGNASRFIERTVTAHPAVECRAYLFSDGKILVSGFESEDRAAAETFMKENRAICPEMWIFSK